MRLLVHSLWQCNNKGCHGFPLQLALCAGKELEERRALRQIPDLEATEIITQPYDPELVISMLDKIVDYDVLKNVTTSLGLRIPNERPIIEKDNNTPQQTAAMKEIHRALFEFHVVEGTLTCPDCGHVYPISNGIPDFVQTRDNEE